MNNNVIQTSPNQRVVLVNKTDLKGKGKQIPYITCAREAMEEASRILTPTGFKLYMYFVSNQNDYKSAFSPEHFVTCYGGNKRSAQDAFNLLIEKKYLTQSNNQKNLYIFHDKPVASISVASGKEVRKEFYDNDSGQYVKLTFKELIEALGGDKAEARELWEETE